MPVARIYASLVEEAEPICADLLARGYNVEVVFPDAVLPNPADLELRVERCSAEQAIARVEAGGSSSRCVFVTPAKGPRRELLLVEMTVLATGTDGRHPITMPGMALVPQHLTNLPILPANPENAIPGMAEVLLFPNVTPDPVPDTLVAGTAPENTIVNVPQTERPPMGKRKSDPNQNDMNQSDQNLSKEMIAELNVFLAHAPVVERPDGLHVRIFENVRQSVGVERARKNWEGLAVAGVAASLLLLLALGWYAGPNPPQPVIAGTSSRASQAAEAPSIFAPLPARVAASSLNPAKVKPVALASSKPLRLASETRHLVSRPRRRWTQPQDNLVAQDRVVRTVPKTRRPLATRLSPAPPTTTSELIRPAAIRSSPIKIITDLK